MRSARQLLLREMLADSAERFWRHAEVRSEHPLRYLERNSWVGLQKIQVTLLGRQAQRVHDSPIFSGGVFLERYTEHCRKGGDAFNHPLVRRLVEQQEVGMPDRVDEAFTRRSSREKRAIPDPPVLGREFEDDLIAVRVGHTTAHAALGDQCRMAHRLASALQELTGAKRGWNEELFQKIELCRCEGCLALEVRP